MKKWLLACSPLALAAVLAALPTASWADPAPTDAASPDVVLPRPEPPFAGRMGRTVDQSVAAFPTPVRAPADAPNVLLIMTDDVGFGASSTFGGPIATPGLTRLAESGLRYNRFETVGICSPTRAALLTGRNHHSVGMGLFPELATGYPGYDAEIPKSAATIAEVLRLNGYSTAMFGKNHSTPLPDLGPTGPFDRWPTGLGFEYFYGFNAFGANQYTPPLYENTHPIDPPYNDPHYILDDDLANHAIAWIRTQKAVAPDKPFFVYYATGSTHAPHQAPRDWIDRFRGRFDQGWDRMREETLARQKALGIVPANTELTPRPAGIPAWDSLTSQQKRIYARMMEVYAGMLAYSDFETRRVVDAVAATGQLDNTLIIFIEGDNGASAEGTLQGSTNETGTLSGQAPETLDYLDSMLGQLGGPMSYGHYPAGWAWAMDAPFQWTKQIASHFGGTRNGFVVSWPKGISAHGEIRSQFHHVVDIFPTILEAAGLPAPTVVDGVRQMPLEGVSMEYSFNAPQAPGRHHVQYFELIGNRGIYADDWFANTTPKRVPWQVGSRPPGDAADDYQWELYDLRTDFSQAHNLAQQNPRKLKELQDLWWREAAAHNVLPVDDSFVDRPALSGAAPTFNGDRRSFRYFPGEPRIPIPIAPDIGAHSFSVTVEVVTPVVGPTAGALATFGGRFGGWAFVVLDGKPALIHARSQQAKDIYRVAATQVLPAGRSVVRFDVDYDRGRAGGPAAVTIKVNDAVVASGRLERTSGAAGAGNEPMSIGRDWGTPVSADYASPFDFSGTLDYVQVDLK